MTGGHRVVADHVGPIAPMEVAFDARTATPDVVSAVLRQCPELSGWLDILSSGLPFLDTTSPARGCGVYRLAGHYRSVCRPLIGSDGTNESDTLIIKGSEPLAADYAEYVRWMTTARFRQHDLPMAEYFPQVQGGAPGAVSMFEAVREQRITSQIHSDHLLHYGELAHAPVPLTVYAFTPAQNEACASTLKRLLSPSSFERVNPLVRRGLGAIAFYYPASPIRVDAFSAMNEETRRKMSTPLDVERMVDGWVRVFVRMLYLGYVPFAPWAVARGCCFDTGNAAVDGGVLDCDSVVPASSVHDDLHFYRAVVLSMDILRRSVACALGLSQNDGDSVFRYLSLTFLASRLNTALATEARPGLSLDPRISDCISGCRPSALRTCLRGARLSTTPYDASSATSARDALPAVALQ
jgi:hypothetical protein